MSRSLADKSHAPGGLAARHPPQSLSGLSLGCVRHDPSPVRIERVSADPEKSRGRGRWPKPGTAPALMSGRESACRRPMIQGPRPIKLILGNAESTSLCDERQRLGRLFVVGSLGPGWVFPGLHDVRSSCAPAHRQHHGRILYHDFRSRWAVNCRLTKVTVEEAIFGQYMIFVTFVISRV